jgi:hypothetical protein
MGRVPPKTPLSRRIVEASRLDARELRRMQDLFWHKIYARPCSAGTLCLLTALAMGLLLVLTLCAAGCHDPCGPVRDHPKPEHKEIDR